MSTSQIKVWYQSKVVWLAIIQGVIGIFMVLETQLGSVGWILVGKSVLDVILRTVTNLPIAGAKRK